MASVEHAAVPTTGRLGVASPGWRVPAAYVIANVIVDLAYVIVDPRIRYS